MSTIPSSARRSRRWSSRAPARTLDVEELRAFAAKALAYYKVPTQWEVRTEPLPRNASGKLDKEPLRTGAAPNFVEE